MTQARNYKSKLVLDFETTFGANPGSAAGLIMPFNACEILEKQNLIEVGTIRGNRNPVQPVLGRKSVDGSLTVPMDYNAIGYWLKSLLGDPTTTNLSTAGYLTGAISVDDTIGTWTAVTDGSFNITINGSANDITGLNFSTDSDMDDVAARIQAAIRVVATGGFTLATVTYTASTKYFKITSGTLGTASSVALLTAAASGTNISGASFMKCAASPAAATAGVTQYQHLFKVGDSQPSLVLSKEFSDISQYFLYNGCKISTFQHAFGEDKEYVASMEVMGAGRTLSGSAYDGSATEVTLDRINGFQASLKEGGSTSAIVTGGDFTINAGLDGNQYVLGSTGKRGDIPEGIMQVSGTIAALFTDATLLNKGINATESSLEVIYTKDTVTSLSFEFPEIQYEVTDPVVTGPVGAMVNLAWRGFYTNDADASAVVVTLKNTTIDY